MLEILPIKSLRDGDELIFGSLNISLAKLLHLGFPIAPGIVVSAPNLHLQTILEHYDFETKEVFEQSLTLVKKEIEATTVPKILNNETKGVGTFLVNGEKIKSVKKLWLGLLFTWIEQIKKRLWKDGFYLGIAEDLDPALVSFIKVLDGLGVAYIDSEKEVVVEVSDGITHPRDLKRLDELITNINKKLFIPYTYEWIVDHGDLKITKILQLASANVILGTNEMRTPESSGVGFWTSQNDRKKSAVKVFLNLSNGSTDGNHLDGVYFQSEKIFDLNKPKSSFEDLTLKLVEVGKSLLEIPVLFKLADKSEGMGKLRGALRLIHQESLLELLMDSLLFARNKEKLSNIQLVIPFTRAVSEMVELRRKLAVKNISRRDGIKFWLEISVPENIINLEDYLLTGLDGVVLNLDELSAHFGGYDPKEQELSHYKKEVSGLLKFLEDGIKLLHKSKVPFVTNGNLILYPEVLEYLVEHGVYGIVVERYEADAGRDLLLKMEKKMILRRIS